MAEFRPEDWEAAKWGMAVEAVTQKFRQARGDVLADAAARGFTAPTGDVLRLVQAAAYLSKAQLTEENAKIYAEQLERLQKERETEQKWVFGLAKLDMAALKADLDNKMLLEKAAKEYDLDAHKAWLEELKSEVEKQQAAIIEERADIEHEANYWRLQAIEAEGLTLDAQVQLARERVKTAEEKARIISVLYEVVAAEQLVILAEQRRAAALQQVAEAEKEVAEIKKTMIPYMVQKAEARMQEAEAIKEEAAAREALEELGYRRLELKAVQEEAEHQQRLAELALEEARKRATEADRMTQLAQAQARTAIQNYENVVGRELLVQEEALKQSDVRFDIARRLFRENLENRLNIRLLDVKKRLALQEAQAKINHLLTHTKNSAKAITTSRKKVIVRTDHNTTYHYISKG